MRIDPVMQEHPWEIIYDERGRVIGEIFLLIDWSQPRERKGKRHGKANRKNKGLPKHARA